MARAAATTTLEILDSEKSDRRGWAISDQLDQVSLKSEVVASLLKDADDKVEFLIGNTNEDEPLRLAAESLQALMFAITMLQTSALDQLRLTHNEAMPLFRSR